MLRARRQSLGYDYGDFTAHNGLWEAAESTAYDVLLRMTLVARVFEASGLDAKNGMRVRLRKIGDIETVAILEVIVSEDVQHVTIGTRGLQYLCAQRRHD